MQDHLYERSGQISRRLFTVAVAGSPALFGQQRQPGNPLTVQNLGPQYGKRPPIDENAPFGEPLTFTRDEITCQANPFPLSQVRLLAGPFRQAADANYGYMERLAVDRLLHNFRLNAGLPSPATPLGGWESPKSELRGHFTGHYLSACALRYASAGDQEAKARGDESVAELARVQNQLGKGGYLSAFPLEFFDRLDQRKGVWAPFYTVHKIMAGLLDMRLHAGNQQALEVVSKMANWVDEWSASKSETHMQEILKTEYGGMNEVLYNVSAVANESRWAQAGDRFNKKEFLTPLAQRRDELRNLHANTHIPQVIGAARRFELSRDPRFRDAAEFFWYAVTSARTYATGGSSNAEAWLTDPGHLSLELKASTHHQECCCSYNMMKLTRHLYSWSGDPRYFDYYERNLFNHRLGAIQPDTGRSIYFLSMAPGAWKTLNTEDQTFWCCTGSALEDFAKLNDSIYYQDTEGIRVNLFVASELDAKEKGIRLRQDTTFPDSAATSLTVVATPSSPWTLRLRIPSWTRSASVKINGRTIEASPGPGSYAGLSRVWKKGDRVELSMPMRLTSEPMPDDPTVQAFLYGPIVLAGDLGSQGLTKELIEHQQGPETRNAPMQVPALRAQGKHLEDWIKPGDSSALTFRIPGADPSITLRPLNRIWGRFAAYWSVA
jgi:DUF1680 family protein